VDLLKWNENKDNSSPGMQLNEWNGAPSESAVSSSTKTNLFFSRQSERKDGLLLKER